MSEYVHGYDQRESTRLQDQAFTLTELLHSDTGYPAGSRLLEVGCGVGAQTLALAQHSPEALITAIDISHDSIAEAERIVTAAGIGNVHFRQADIFQLPDDIGVFDHVFVCFVLEHLADPAGALAVLQRQLKPGGTITVIEGDHGSTFFYPDSEAAHKAIHCQVALQQQSGGDAMIGRRLYPLLSQAGFASIQVSPRMVYVDASKPELVDGLTRSQRPIGRCTPPQALRPWNGSVGRRSRANSPPPASTGGGWRGGTPHRRMARWLRHVLSIDSGCNRWCCWPSRGILWHPACDAPLEPCREKTSLGRTTAPHHSRADPAIGTHGDCRAAVR